jgi:predicted DNA-binding WGR domain protein
MAWFDRYKTEQIYVQQAEGHNKFWAASQDTATNRVIIRWGRLGTKGQSQVKDFPGAYGAVNFIDSKVREKTNKGYHKIDQSKFDRLALEAAIVGTQNKCHNFKWVEITDERNLIYKPVNEDRLQDPGCNPGIYVEVETKKQYGGCDSFRFLFTFTQAFEVAHSRPVLITKTNPLYELTSKVEEAIGRTLSA